MPQGMTKAPIDTLATPVASVSHCGIGRPWPSSAAASGFLDCPSGRLPALAHVGAVAEMPLQLRLRVFWRCCRRGRFGDVCIQSVYNRPKSPNLCHAALRSVSLCPTHRPPTLEGRSQIAHACSDCRKPRRRCSAWPTAACWASWCSSRRNQRGRARLIRQPA